MTLPMAEAKGLLGLANQPELYARCPRELLGVPEDGPDTWSKMLSTANVLRQDGLLLATPRTFGWAGAGPKPT